MDASFEQALAEVWRQVLVEDAKVSAKATGTLGGPIHAGDHRQRDNLLVWKQTCVQQLRCSTDKAI